VQIFPQNQSLRAVSVTEWSITCLITSPPLRLSPNDRWVSYDGQDRQWPSGRIHQLSGGRAGPGFLEPSGPEGRLIRRQARVTRGRPAQGCIYSPRHHCLAASICSSLLTVCRQPHISLLPPSSPSPPALGFFTCRRKCAVAPPLHRHTGFLHRARTHIYRVCLGLHNVIGLTLKNDRPII
jgi:hypothetical protein